MTRGRGHPRRCKGGKPPQEDVERRQGSQGGDQEGPKVLLVGPSREGSTEEWRRPWATPRLQAVEPRGAETGLALLQLREARALEREVPVSSTLQGREVARGRSQRETRRWWCLGDWQVLLLLWTRGRRLPGPVCLNGLLVRLGFLSSMLRGSMLREASKSGTAPFPRGPLSVFPR